MIIIEHDHLYLKKLITYLNSFCLNILGTYTSGKSGLQAILKKEPHVVLVDLDLPDMSGIELMKRVLNKGLNIEMIVLSNNEDENQLFSAFKYGAVGYILKNKTDPNEITSLIENVVNDCAFISPRMAKRILMTFREKHEINFVIKLTPREREILEYLCQGFAPKKISLMLNISYQTVRVHLKNIYKKLQVNSLVEALALCRKYKKNNLVE
ncbi:response regulator transcription factor [Thermosulfuriphilus ammonigenes]|uniref:Response regulator transcription factor n=1 Tax=Thermosulfuriphilus ammonigenes TaxID=1936021 RepID=A0A6G7PUM7_9BACT|nr:response regulator transcription factor [Thermosulfuriphilus ammonigenes]MBA2848489.1 DNA-binding NarL/FixJ family response regulator [Thermosulfuriphilus ammonigenes]QIJ71362.1 response regulator transcription factor [Thermosulfuriphilus ammonigenes]